MDKLDAEPVAGTDGAIEPFFSPDGEWVGFFADDKLKKVAVAGGSPLTLTAHQWFRYASWGPDDRIYFPLYDKDGHWSVAAGGGAPEVATTCESCKSFALIWPQVLPGATALLVTTMEESDNATIGVVSLKTNEYKVLIEGGTFARYAPTGHLVYARTGALFAVPFDLERLEVNGPPTRVLDGVRQGLIDQSAQVAFSASGTLVYVPGSGVPGKSLVWVDRQGQAQPAIDEQRTYFSPRIVPRGQRIAVQIREEGNWDIWTYDLPRAALTRLTLAESHEEVAVWTPDGERVTFYSTRDGAKHVYWKRADGSGPAERLGENRGWPQSWSPDGRVLAIKGGGHLDATDGA